MKILKSASLKVALLSMLVFTWLANAQTSPPKWKLVWNENPEPEIISYGVYVSNTSGGTYTLVTTVPDVNGQPQGWVVPVGTYDGKFFRVSALNDAGLESDLSTFVKIPLKPVAPSGLNRVLIP